VVDRFLVRTLSCATHFDSKSLGTCPCLYIVVGVRSAYELLRGPLGRLKGHTDSETGVTSVTLVVT
jgi:hypothetical protein